MSKDTAIAAASKPDWYDGVVVEFTALAKRYENLSTVAEVEDAAQLRNAIASKVKEIEATYKEAKSLADKAHKAIVKIEKDLITPLKALDAEIVKALGKWGSKQEEIRLRLVREQEELDSIVAEMAGFDDDDTPAVETKMVFAAPKVAGMHYRDKHTFTITNPDLIPEKYVIKSFDTAKIQLLVDAMGARAEEVCPGITYKLEKIPVRE